MNLFVQKIQLSRELKKRSSLSKHQGINTLNARHDYNYVELFKYKISFLQLRQTGVTKYQSNLAQYVKVLCNIGCGN